MQGTSLHYYMHIPLVKQAAVNNKERESMNMNSDMKLVIKSASIQVNISFTGTLLYITIVVII